MLSLTVNIVLLNILLLQPKILDLDSTLGSDIHIILEFNLKTTHIGHSGNKDLKDFN